MDTIADMLIRIKNGQTAKKSAVSFGYSRLRWEISKILERAGYIGVASKKGRKNKKLIEVALLYDSKTGQPVVSNVRRMSRLGRRLYRGFREIHAPRNGFGTAVYSTPKGLLTDREARKEKVGGEVLFEIW